MNLGAGRLAHVEHHDDEQEQDHHGADVNEDLDGGQEGGAEKDEEGGHLDQGDHEGQRAVNRVPGHDDEQRRGDGNGRKKKKEAKFHGICPQRCKRSGPLDGVARALPRQRFNCGA